MRALQKHEGFPKFVRCTFLGVLITRIGGVYFGVSLFWEPTRWSLKRNQDREAETRQFSWLRPKNLPGRLVAGVGGDCLERGLHPTNFGNLGAEKISRGFTYLLQ